MTETWRGIYPITSFVLEALGRKRDAGRESGSDAGLSKPEQLLLVAVEFWAAAAHGTLDSWLRPDPAAKLATALHAFEGIGAVRVASILRVGVESLRGHGVPEAPLAEVITQLDERLARTDDNVDDLIARYAARLEDPAAFAARP
ncbi:MAG: hypothetical protein WCD08_02695 [Steroidobacteraceae bacterium]